MVWGIDEEHIVAAFQLSRLDGGTQPPGRGFSLPPSSHSMMPRQVVREWSDGSEKLGNGEPVAVLHVFPQDLARGAQRRAGALSRQLDTPEEPHRTLAIFATDQPAGLADYALDVRRTSLAGLAEPQAVRRLRQLLRTVRPSIVIAYGSEALRYTVLARRRDQVVVYSKTGVSAASLCGARLIFHRYLASKADMVAAVSSATAQEAEELLRVDARRVVVVSNGRDPNVFEPPPSRAHGGAVRILWVGELSEGKRPELFIELIKRLRLSGLEVDASMVGTGPLTRELGELARSADVAMLGQRADVPDLMQLADVLVFTSRGDGEGMPGVLIEAGLSGLPVVATYVAGASDVVIDHQTGFLSAIEDADKMEAALSRLVQSEALRTEMGACARLHCVQGFTIAASAARWQSLLSGFRPST